MHLSFQFDDFFCERNSSLVDRSDVKTPTFLVRGGVGGVLKIKDVQEALLSDGNARIEINLEGFMKTELDTSIQSHIEFLVTFEKKILSMTQTLSVEDHADNVAPNQCHYPFSFNVQSWLRCNGENSLLHKCLSSRSNFASLPPSLKHETVKSPQGAPQPYASAEVTYRLTARLLKDRKTIGWIVQPILLLVSHDPTPPLCMTDFAGEYRMTQKCLLRGPLFQKSGELSVHVQEPKQLTVKADCIQSMVGLPVKLRWKRQKQEAHVDQSPRIEAKVKWQFRISTFVSILEQRGPATLKRVLVSPETAFVCSKLPAKALTMAWRQWTPAADEDSSTIIESEQSLWLTLPRSEILTPTFWSPFLSRRYSLWLQLKVTKPGNTRLEVEVPIQVGIDASSYVGSNGSQGGDVIGDRGLFDSAEGDEPLPQYIQVE